MPALKIVYPEKATNDGSAAANMFITAIDANAIKAAINDHATEIDKPVLKTQFAYVDTGGSNSTGVLNDAKKTFFNA